MKNKYLRTLGSILITSVFLLLAFGSDDSKKGTPSELKTSFNNCDDLVAYTRYSAYSDLKAKWGEGSIGQAWDASTVGDFKMKIKVKWMNITCNGKPVEIMFNNYHSGRTDAFDKNPASFDGIFCDEYK